MEMRSVLKGVAFFSLMQASCLAYSQSNITLYGIIDTGVEYYNHAAGGGSFTGVPTLAGEVPSGWGLTGVEDLGGGNKAFFRLENGFAPGTGGFNYGGREFGRPDPSFSPLIASMAVKRNALSGHANYRLVVQVSEL